MSKRLETDFLKDMFEASRRAVEYCNGMDYNSFANDMKTQDAVIRNIEIIGEAVKNLTEQVRDKYSDIPWKSIANLNVTVNSIRRRVCQDGHVANEVKQEA